MWHLHPAPHLKYYFLYLLVTVDWQLSVDQQYVDQFGHDSLARIVEISGVMHDLKVKNGVTRHQLDRGIYVIVLNGRSHKISIR